MGKKNILWLVLLMLLGVASTAYAQFYYCSGDHILYYVSEDPDLMMSWSYAIGSC